MKIFLPLFILASLCVAILIYRPQIAISLHYLGRPDPYDYRNQRRKAIANLDTLTPPGSIIFLGDSMTERLHVAEVSPRAYNYGVGANTIKDLSNRLGDYQALKTARLIVLEIGTNDKDNFREGDLSELAAKLPPVPVLWYAAPPVDGKIAEGGEIAAINIKASELCGKINNCRFVDLKSGLADSAGNLRYHVGDGVHFNLEANQIWLQDLKSRV